jgi:regulator of protease activity HflC (stomatin/prohibitin superfamily)
MTWIILTVIALLCFFVAIGYALWESKTWSVRVKAWQDAGAISSERPTSYALVGWSAAGLTAGLWLFISGLMMFHTVGQRQVAIVYNFSGTIAGKKDPGVVTTWPFQHVKKENVGIQHDEWVFGEENSAVSKDQQKIFGRLSVNYQIDAANVVDLYKRVGAAWKTIIIDARVPQVFKETTATYQTADITAQREKLRKETKERLADELKPYDISVIDVFVTNLGFSKIYSDAIDQKQKQVQDALRAEAKIRESEAIAKQKVAEAKGAANANIAIARGDATANRLRQRSLTPRLIQWEAIQKLNDKVQLIICPPNAVCVPNTFIPTGANGTTP